MKEDLAGKNDLTPEQLYQLARLAALPDDQIDTADIPEAPVENWIHAPAGSPRPLK